ncbi:MAG TPA: M43 family zinc metalloprotease, partial [Acidobacteriota bacterium]|nr:M43 family zinc metalloprotease [Acidobacteriota bacterium]
DPIHNYMDYSSDACYNNFTSGQDARADFMMATYRPVIGSARLADFGGETGNGRSADAFDMGARKADTGEDVYRCATDERGPKIDAPTKAQIDEYLATNRIAAGGVIPVHFHVIYGRNNEGNIPESWIDDQIAVLNYNYAGRDYNGNVVSGAANTGYTFTKASVDRRFNRQWFGMTPGSKAERDAKNALVLNPTSALNFYTCKPGQNLLGWATFPWNLAGNPNMDGVVVHFNSLPGGTLAPYNLGGTGSHEVGHWVGLYHTFQGGCGGDCATTGDLVCDTPAQSTATSGCPAGKNTCAAPGDDPIHNYMDYSSDACYNNFTSGQDARADFMMATYRPVIGSGRIANSAGRPNAAREAGEVLVGLSARPNPFNPRTKIEFGLRREGQVTLRVFDVQGRLAATLVNGRMPAGNHEVEFNGDRLASGVYMMRLQMPDGVEMTRRITLMK